jgi:Rrf2 family protein
MMLDLAQHREDGYISLKTIAERQGISKRYLDQIMLLINRTDYLKTTRGAQGGYKLAKAPNRYSLGDILRLTEGGFAPLTCLENGGEDCDRYAECRARGAWQGLEKVMADYLDNLTLQDILDQYDDDVPQDFSI